MFSLDDQIILVTGASRGIGAATAKMALAAGGTVVGSYCHSPGALDELRSDYGGDRVHAVQSDLSKPRAGATLWREALDAAGRIDGLVNNAGIAPMSDIDDEDEVWYRDWAEVLAVNTQAVADLCREAVRAFREAGGGRIVNVASRAAFRGDTPDGLHYAASKGAVVALTRSIARGYAKDGILAFIVAPGWVKTDMASVIYEGSHAGYESALAEIPLGDAAPPEQVANMIVFLLSGMIDHATGATFDINGASYVR
jgi:NAD(P)-dependent dehydrogenase (short-subunit alcohol dehydrogenase family)